MNDNDKKILGDKELKEATGGNYPPYEPYTPEEYALAGVKYVDNRCFDFTLYLYNGIRISQECAIVIANMFGQLGRRATDEEFELYQMLYPLK